MNVYGFLQDTSFSEGSWGPTDGMGGHTGLGPTVRVYITRKRHSRGDTRLERVRGVPQRTQTGHMRVSRGTVAPF